jgi:hypothetical protein
MVSCVVFCELLCKPSRMNFRSSHKLDWDECMSSSMFSCVVDMYRSLYNLSVTPGQLFLNIVNN